MCGPQKQHANKKIHRQKDTKNTKDTKKHKKAKRAQKKKKKAKGKSEANGGARGQAGAAESDGRRRGRLPRGRVRVRRRVLHGAPRFGAARRSVRGTEQPPRRAVQHVAGGTRARPRQQQEIRDATRRVRRAVRNRAREDVPVHQLRLRRAQAPRGDARTRAFWTERSERARAEGSASPPTESRSFSLKSARCGKSTKRAPPWERNVGFPKEEQKKTKNEKTKKRK